MDWLISILWSLTKLGLILTFGLPFVIIAIYMIAVFILTLIKFIILLLEEVFGISI